MELLARTDSECPDDLRDDERRLLETLDEGPQCLDEIAQRLDARHWQFLPLERLEPRHLVQRSALTPTDVLHANGALELWNAEAARRFCGLFCRLLGVSESQLATMVHDRIVRRLASELLQKQLAGQLDGERLEGSAAASALVDNWLAGGNDDYRVRIGLRYPIIGIGAPIHFYLPDAARLLDCQAVIPTHADVANAIGAITSRVLVQVKLEIVPGENGRYRLAGLPDAPSFGDFQQAQQYAVQELTRIVRRRARESGTEETRVEILVHDHVAPAAGGNLIFLGRDLTARLAGRPTHCTSALGCG